MAGSVDDGDVVLVDLELPESDVDGDTTLMLGLQVVQHTQAYLKELLPICKKMFVLYYFVLVKKTLYKTSRGEYFTKYLNLHSVIYWIFFTWVEFVLKAWIYCEKYDKKSGFSFQSGPNLMSFAFNWG